MAAARFLIDNSVWQRQRQPPVRAALDRLRDHHGPWSILICPPVAAEVGFSARNSADHAVITRALATFTDCAIDPSSADVLDLQRALIGGGFFRAVGALDTVIAAYAVVNEATLVHYDRDFEHVARVHPALSQTWIAPAGTLDR